MIAASKPKKAALAACLRPLARIARIIRRVRAFIAALSAFALCGAAATPGDGVPSTPYRWQNVAIVGGGFVDGLAFHPTQAQLLYARTDMGGAYRRDADSGRWQPLLDWLSHADLNLMAADYSQHMTIFGKQELGWVVTGFGAMILPLVHVLWQARTMARRARLIEQSKADPTTL